MVSADDSLALLMKVFEVPREESVQVPGSELGGHPVWWAFLDLQITWQHSPSHTSLAPPVSDARLLYPTLRGKEPEESILKAEAAPGDPGKLLGRKRRSRVLS